MPLENAEFISELVPANPPDADNPQEGASQIRVTKKALQQSFPNIDAVVTATPDDLNQLSGITLSELMPTGAVILWAATSIPNGWLECDGEPVLPQYTALIALIGPNKPDLSNKFVRGSYLGREPMTTEAENVGAHGHSYDAFTANQLWGVGGTFQVATQKNNGLLTSGNPTGENRPANTAMMYLIKT